MRRYLRKLKHWYTGYGDPWPQPGRLNPWLDRRGAPRAIRTQLRRGAITAEQAVALEQWHRHGYVILRGVIDDGRIGRVLDDFERFWAERTVIGGHRRPPERDPYGHFTATINVHMQSRAVREVFLDP